MTLTRTKWQRPEGYGLAPMHRSYDGLGQLLQSFGDIFESPLDMNPEAWLPPVDVHDSKDRVTIRAELPGMKKEEIDISLQDGVLILSGERKGGQDASGGGVARRERWFGRFQRSISLPYKVDTRAIKAAYTDGVLTVELAKAEEAKPKQIKVQFNN